jgi:hypothetical protein
MGRQETYAEANADPLEATSAKGIAKLMQRMLLNIQRASQKDREQRPKRPVNPLIPEDLQDLQDLAKEHFPSRAELQEQYDRVREKGAIVKDKRRWFSADRATENEYEKLHGKVEELATEQNKAIAHELLDTVYTQSEDFGGRLDKRNLSIISQLADIDEGALVRGVGTEEEKLLTVTANLTRSAITSGYSSEAAIEARELLHAIEDRYGGTGVTVGVRSAMREMVTIADKTAEINYFDGIEGVEKFPQNTHAAKVIERINNRYASVRQTQQPLTEDDYRNFQDMLASVDRTDTLDLDQTEALSRLKRQVERDVEMHSRARQSQDVFGLPMDDRREKVARYGQYNSLYLESETGEHLMIDYNREVEELQRLSEANTDIWSDTVISEGAKKKLELVGQYLTSHQFRTDYDLYFTEHWQEKTFQERFGGAGIGEEALKKNYSDYMEKARGRELADKISNRGGILQATGTILGLGDAEKVGASLLNVGTHGLQGLLEDQTGNAGMVGKAFNKFTRVLDEISVDPKTGKRRRVDATLLKQAEQQVVKEFVREKDLYYDKYVKKLNLDPEKIKWEEEVKAFTRQAQYATVITQRMAVAMMHGLGPGQDYHFSSFETATTLEQLLGAMDIEEWNFEKWTNLEKGPQLVWDNGCRFAAMDTGRDIAIKRRLAEAYRSSDSDELLRLTKMVFGEGVDKDGNNVEAASLKKLLTIDINGNERKHLPTSYEDLIYHHRDLLEDRLIVYEGRQVVRSFLGLYDHFGSSWRNGLLERQLGLLYGKDAENLALGLRVYDAGQSLIKVQKSEHTPEYKSAAEKVIKELEKVGKFRPHQIIQFLTEGSDKDTKKAFTEWASSVFAPLMGENAADIRPDSMFRFISQRFVSINELLAENKLPVIDYLKGPTAEQRVHVEAVCTALGTNTDEYLEGMKTMAKFSLQEHDGKFKHLEKLVEDPLFRDIYRRAWWTDDARINYLDTPAEQDGFKFSDRAGVNGRGRNDPLVRTWFDASTGMKLPMLVFDALQPDEKTHLENVVKIFRDIKQYAGNPVAARAAADLMAGWGKTARTFTLQDYMFLGDSDWSSAMKNVFGNDAPSHSKNEIHHFLQKADSQLLSRLKLMAPETHEYLEQYLGLSNKLSIPGTDFHISTNLPLTLFRARLFFVVAGATVIIAAASEGFKVFSEDVSGSGGHH